MTKVSIIKAALVAMTLVLTITSCRDRVQESAHTDNVVVKDSARLASPSANSELFVEVEKGVVLNKVKDIFRLLKSEYMYHGGSYDNDLFDKVFCSKSWNKLLLAVRCKEEQSGTLCFEINHWSMTRYSGSMPSYDEFNVENIDLLSPVKRATVAFTVYENDTYTPARIDLVYEDGQWVIDNFHNLKFMIDMRSALWNFVANSQAI